MIVLLEKQLEVKDQLLSNLKAQIESFNKQINVQDKEIKKMKFKNLVAGGGVIVLVILSLVIK